MAGRRVSLVDRALGAVGLRRAASAPRARGAYAGAQMSRTTRDWIFAPVNSANREIQSDVPQLRARSRELARNNSIVKRYLRLVAENVVGPDGIRLQAQVRAADGQKLATEINAQIEREWREFCRPRNASIDGRLSLHGIARMAAALRAMDGEAIVQIKRGAPNAFGLALQVLDADQLDLGYNRTPGRGADGGIVNEIRMGVEIDANLRAVAYHLWRVHPSEAGGRTERVRVPAADIIHLFRLDRPGQLRGVPETHAVMLDIHHLRGYQEAELIAARAAAAKMGFFTRKAEDGVGEVEDDRDDGDRLTMETEAGLATELDPGLDFKPWDPQHPVAAFGDFVKAIARSIATGLGAAYHALFNDYEAVNYSSGRLGMQAERDGWRLEQDDMIEQFYERVYDEFLRFAMLSRRLRLPSADPAQYAARAWQPRGWPSVDPTKEATATGMEIAMGLTTFTDECAKRGVSFEDNIRTLAEEFKLAKAAGVTLSAALPAVPAQPGQYGTAPAGFAIGDRVQPRAGAEHNNMAMGAGTVEEIATPALAVRFDAMPDELHRWYVAAELEPADEQSDAAAPDDDDDNNDTMPTAMPGMSMGGGKHLAVA